MEFNKLISSLQTCLARAQGIVVQIQQNNIIQEKPPVTLKRSASQYPLDVPEKKLQKTLGAKKVWKTIKDLQKPAVQEIHADEVLSQEESQVQE